MIIFIILLIAVTIGIGLLAQIKCYRVSLWLKSNRRNEWDNLPWLYRKAACGQIGVMKIAKEGKVNESSFLALYNSWKRIEQLSWILLAITLIIMLVTLLIQ